MTDHKDLIAPSDYFAVADNKKEIWQKIIGQRLTHKTLGNGTILQDSFSKKIPRESYLLVKFDSGRESLFALDAFNGDKITRLSLSAELIEYIREEDKVKKQKAEEERKRSELEAQVKMQEEENKNRVLLAEEQRLVRIQNEKERINDILDGIIISIKEHIKSLPDLKRLNNVFNNHQKGKYKYADPFEQCAYLLRYLYAYYYEYKEIMKCINQYLTEVNIVSIGCGGGIDALALNCTLNKTISYIGIDIAEWVKIINLSKYGNTKFYTADIKEDTENYLKDATVLFFPKSLSDIKPDAINNIKQWIEPVWQNWTGA